jgi:hypothetical protein
MQRSQGNKWKEWHQRRNKQEDQEEETKIKGKFQQMMSPTRNVLFVYD